MLGPKRSAGNRAGQDLSPFADPQAGRPRLPDRRAADATQRPRRPTRRGGLAGPHPLT